MYRSTKIKETFDIHKIFISVCNKCTKTQKKYLAMLSFKFISEMSMYPPGICGAPPITAQATDQSTSQSSGTMAK